MFTDKLARAIEFIDIDKIDIITLTRIVRKNTGNSSLSLSEALMVAKAIKMAYTIGEKRGMLIGKGHIKPGNVTHSAG